MTLPATSRRPAIPALTSLRYPAALWVALFHVREIGLWRGGSAPYRAIVQLGYLGVSFFFVLSGFILVYTYSDRPVPRPRFWQARFARVYPAYLFSLLVTLPGLLYSLPLARQHHLALVTVLAYPLLLEAWFPSILLFWNAVAWSLSCEAFFYLVFPFALRRFEQLSRRGLRLAIAAAWAASLLFTLTYVVLHPDGVTHPTTLDNNLFWLGVVKLNPIVRLPEFLLGMAVGALFLRHAQPAAVAQRAPASPLAALQPFPATTATAAVLAGAVAILLCVLLQHHIPYPVMHSGLLAPAFALLIAGFAGQPAWSRVVNARPFVLLGESSYSLYLLHTMPIVIATFFLHAAQWPHPRLVVLALLAGTTLVAVAVFLLLENPARRLLRPRNFAPPPDVAAAVPLAAVTL